MEKSFKTEHNIATQAVYEHFIYIIIASFPFCIYLYFYFQYLSTFKIKTILFVLKYNKYHIL